MSASYNPHRFHEAAGCQNLSQAISLIAKSAGLQKRRISAAAHGMVLSARESVGTGKYFEDTRLVLDSLARAKAEIDVAAWHDLGVAKLTAAILLNAQQYVDETTIACTEWALPEDVLRMVIERSLEYIQA